MDDCYEYLQTLDEKLLSKKTFVQRDEKINRAIVFAHKDQFSSHDEYSTRNVQN